MICFLLVALGKFPETWDESRAIVIELAVEITIAMMVYIWF